MKKLFALLAVVLAVASCQKESNDLAVNMGEQETLITVALPEATRANSAQSGLDHVDLNGDYTLRYIFQVFDENGNNGTEQQVVYTDEKAATFRVQLVGGRKYKFVAWTDIVEGEEALHYNVDKNMNVTMTGDWGVMDETRDAFTCSEVHEFNGNMPVLNLKRPFAKIRVVTDDIAKLMGADLENGKVTYTTKVNTSFNALTQTAGTPANREVEFTYGEDNVYFHKYVEKEYQRTLYADYLFVTKNDVVSFILQNNLAKNEFTTDIPVVRNQVTTIFGSLLTSGSDIRVEVKDEFEQPGNTVFDAFERGGTVTLDKDYELGSTLYVESGVKATLNLNGKTLKSLYDANNYTDVIVVEEGAELTINGDGTIEAEGGKSNFTVIVDGKLTINGGTFKSGVDEVNDPNAVIYVRGNGEAYVNGGNFPNELNSKYILNKRDADRATTKIEVRGGRFQNFNPGNNAAENAGTNFLAAGYVSVADGEWFDVVKGATVASVEDFKAALDKAIEDKKEVIVVCNFSTSKPLVIAKDQIATLNLNGKTIEGAFDKDGGALIENNGTLKIVGGTLKNININGDAVINNSGELVLEDVKIEGAPIADGGYPAYAVISSGKMIINNGTEVSSDRGCLKLSNDGETVINGGTFENNDIGSRSLTSHVVDVEKGGSNKLTINGGTFEHRHATTNGGVVICNRTKGTVYVNGGNFSGGNYYGNDNLSDYGYGGTFFVTGGTYTAKPAPKYIANGYKVIEQDGKYVVQE